MLRFLVPNNSDIKFYSLALLTVKRTILRGRHCSRAKLVTGSLSELQLMHQTLVINMQLNSRTVPFLLIAHFNTEFIYLNIPSPPALLLPSDLFALANCCWQGSSSSYIFVTEYHNHGTTTTTCQVQRLNGIQKLLWHPFFVSFPYSTASTSWPTCVDIISLAG